MTDSFTYLRLDPQRPLMVTPEILADPSLSSQAIRLYLFIVYYQDREAGISTDYYRLTSDLQCSMPELIELLAELEERGLIILENDPQHEELNHNNIERGSK